MRLNVPVRQQVGVIELPSEKISSLQIGINNLYHAGAKILFLGDKEDLDWANDMVTFVDDASPIPEGDFNFVIFNNVKILKEPDREPRDLNFDIDFRTLPVEVAFEIEVSDVHHERLDQMIRQGACCYLVYK